MFRAGLYAVYRHFTGFDPRDIGPSQSNEADILDRLLAQVATPRTFCEFGFSLSEFNCGRLLLQGWRGLLIDGDVKQVGRAQAVFGRGDLNVSAVRAFLDTTNVRSILGAHFQRDALGVLSVDVDGNDYWLLCALISLQPAVIVVEYNASFGLRPVSVPYDPTFERHQKHPSGWYHGASMTAFHALGARHGYSLVTVSDSGINLFFVRDELLPPAVARLEPAQAYRENQLRNQWSTTTAAEQWATIGDLPLTVLD
jgi:hypothetical protein